MKQSTRRRGGSRRAMMTRIGLTLGLTLAMMSWAPPAQAYTGTGTAMVATQRMTGPHLYNYRQVGTYAKGKRLTLSCYVRGQSVRGYYGGPSNLWYRVSDGYYVADIDLYTGSNNPITSACPSTPYRLPFTKGTRYWITQGPAQHAAGWSPTYNRHAVDFALPSGTSVRASRSGRVRFQGYDSTGAIQVRLDHGSNYCTQYVHLSRSIVYYGQSVGRGQVIGYSGQTGRATGPHLHWNMVYCDTAKSRMVVNTLEMNTNYPLGTSQYSQNG